MTGTKHRACHLMINVQENTSMKAPGIYYGALAVFCIIALCIGYASAASTTQSTTQHTCTHGKGMRHAAFDLTNATVQQEILTRFEKQGVDTTALRTAFQNGDTAAVKSWFEASFKAHHSPEQNRGEKAQTSS